MQRRNFIKSASAAGIIAGTMPSSLIGKSSSFVTKKMLEEGGHTPEDESYWEMVGSCFSHKLDFVNLENGYCSPQPLSTLEFQIKRQRYINLTTSYYMRGEMSASVEVSREYLSEFLKVPAEEVAITRNTTESLNTVILGFPWKPGDEVVIGDQDYGSMNEAFEQAARRYGIVVKKAKVPVLPNNDDEVVTAYSQLFTKKTKMVHLTHLINLSGHVIPVAKIAETARKLGILVAVDAAHSVAHIDFNISELNADFVAASLHKWLCCPLGLGMLWMRKEHIPTIWPLMADTGLANTDIRRFEHHGTRPFHIIESIPEAIKFHNIIGSTPKMLRLKYLMKKWCGAVSEIRGVSINTPWNDDTINSAIALLNIDGYTPTELSKKLMQEYKIFTVAIEHTAIKGVRITPHLYTSIKDIDYLIKSVKKISSTVKR